MKKILILTFFILFSPVVVFAVSGTCSSHGGVSCSAGPDYDGSPVCNDGWRDSSEEYYATQMCLVDKHLCTQEEFQSLSQENDTSSIENQMSNLISQINQTIYDGQIAYEEALNSGETLGFAQGEASRVQRENELKLAPLQTKYESLYNEYRMIRFELYFKCYWLGDQAYIKSLNSNQPVNNSQDSANYTSGTQSSNPKTPDELCNLSSSGSWYNTATNKCVVCPVNSKRTPNTNICESTIKAPVVNKAPVVDISKEKTTTIEVKKEVNKDIVETIASTTIHEENASTTTPLKNTSRIVVFLKKIFSKIKFW